MGTNVDNIPWPKRQPKRQKPPQGRSGGGDRHTVGMAVILFIGLPLAVLALIGTYIAHGYGLF